MAKKSAKGNRLKYGAKKHFESQGYEVAYTETYFKIVRPRLPPIMIKKDIFGSDIVAMNGKEIIFINVTTKHNKADRAAKLKAHKWPPFVKLAVMYKEKGKWATVHEMQT